MQVLRIKSNLSTSGGTKLRFGFSERRRPPYPSLRLCVYMPLHPGRNGSSLPVRSRRPAWRVASGPSRKQQWWLRSSGCSNGTGQSCRLQQKKTRLRVAAHPKAADRLPCAWEEHFKVHLLKFRRQADVRKSTEVLTAWTAYKYGKDCKGEVWIAKSEDWALESVSGGLYHCKVVKLLKLRDSFLCALGRTVPDRNTRWVQSL